MIPLIDREFPILSYPIVSNLCESRWKTIFTKALTRPFLLFAFEPIIQVLGIYMAFLYGLFYSLYLFPSIFACSLLTPGFTFSLLDDHAKHFFQCL